jgi:hypothetical protein
MANNFKSNLTSYLSLTSSHPSPANVYVCQAGTTATIIGMSISNILTNNQITANVILTSGTTSANLVRNAPISPGQSLIPIGGDQKIVLKAGDYISVSASLINSADVIVSALEIT